MRFLFHFIASFRGKKPPCCDVLFVRFGRGSAVQVFSIVSEILCVMSSNFVHVSNHWSGLRCWLVSRRVVSALICVEFSSKNDILNFSRFSSGIGLSIRVDGMVVRVGAWL